ncbi:MAG: ERCC4 domain-containing protein [Desulfovibrionaceae bacterium]
MKIIRDTREHRPFLFGGYDCEVEVGTLATGDYSLAGLIDRVAVERKSLDDLVSCLMGAGRNRFTRELARAAALEQFVVVVEATMEDIKEGRYRSKMAPNAALQSVLAFQARYGTSILWAGNRALAEEATFHFLRHYLRDERERLRVINREQGGMA